MDRLPLRIINGCIRSSFAICDTLEPMPTTTAKRSRKKTPMSDQHKAALAKGREEGRTVRSYLEALEASKPRRGRRRTPDSIKKRLVTIDIALADADPLSRLQLIQEQQDLDAELAYGDNTVDIDSLEKAFTKVAKSYGERKGISYSAWRRVGVSAPVLQQAKIARTRG
jgi:hypothetical protein